MNASSPALSRVVGTWGAVWMGLGSILGTGVFVSLGIASGIAGDGFVVAIVLAAILAMANGLSSAQLAAAHPVSGGTYEYGHRFVHPAAGFAAGWMFLVAKSASAATAALGSAGYVLHLLGLRADVAPRVGLALLFVLGLTVLVAGGVTRSNRANIAIVAFTFVSLGAFVVTALLHLDAEALAARLGSGALVDTLSHPRALFHATALLFVAYTGYGRIATLGEEVKEPARTIPRAIVVTLVLSMALYAAVGMSAVGAVGAEAFADATRQVGAPLEVIVRPYSSTVALVVAAGAVSAMLGVLLNLLLGLSRVLLAMARRREMPAAFADIDERTRSPRRAVWGVAGLIAVIALFGEVKTTWSFSAFTVLVYYGLTNLSALRLPREHRRFPAFIAAFGLVGCLALAFFVEPLVWGAGLLTLAGGFGWRAMMARRSA